MYLALNKTLEKFKLKSIKQERLQEFVDEGMLKLSKNVLKFSGANLNLLDDFFLMYREEYSENLYYLTTLMPGECQSFYNLEAMAVKLKFKI